jgi:Taurine catabolism dioxygenase TauD, TfdA family
VTPETPGFPAIWLAAQALAAHGGTDPDPRTEDGKVLWQAGDLAAPHTADWAAYTSDDRVREGCLSAVARYGCALLHCLRDARSNGAVAGGDTALVDGFAAAAALRAADPEPFGVLTGTPVPFGYIDKETDLTARQPLISLSPRGRIAGIRYNDRSMLPLRLPPAEAEAAYAAILVWARLLARPEFLLRLRLSPGDCLIFDNTRVLHARTAFAATGERHLQGCYADLDGLLSTLAVLRRRQ